MTTTESPDAGSLNGPSTVSQDTLISACASVPASGGFKCGASTEQLSIHHFFYNPQWSVRLWEYSDSDLAVVDRNCHERFENARAILLQLVGKHVEDLAAAMVKANAFGFTVTDVVGRIEAIVERLQLNALGGSVSTTAKQ